MARNRSRDAETEDVNQRRLRRGAVKRQHLGRWAVGHDELAPGVVGPGHLQPSTVETIRESVAGSGVGQVLLVSATGQSFASGGDYVTADTIVYQHGFDQVTAAGDSIVWPVDFAGGWVQVEFAWDTYEGGGTIEIEVDGVVPAWGLVGSGTSGRVGCKGRGVHIAEGAVVKVKVTQSSGTSKTGDVLVEFSAPDPAMAVVATPAVYSEVVLADGPVAYWQLNETAGTSAADATGNGHTGTYAGTYSLGAAGVMQDGSGDTALDVTTTGVTGSDWADLEFAGTLPYSIECWFNADAIGSASQILVQKQVISSGAGWEVVIVGGATMSVVATRGSGGGASVSSPTSSIVAGTDYHVVVTFDGTDARMYLDGDEVDVTGVAGGSMGTNSVVLSIGYDSAGGAGTQFNGRIDEVAIYDRALTAVEVAEHHTVGVGGAV